MTHLMCMNSQDEEVKAHMQAGSVTGHYILQFSTDMQRWVLIIELVLALPALGLDNGLLRTPPMGWLSWERFRCNVDCHNDPKNCISEALFKDMADRLAEDGWKELGYEYIIMDDCWPFIFRDKDGRLVPDIVRFPGGITKLADYVHDRGLKLGIYADMGKYTCEGYPGTTLDKIEIDAQTFASWEVDLLKFDGCYSSAEEQQEGYPLMSKALNATGRPMAYMCGWPLYRGGLPPSVNYTLMGEICNTWRNYVDIQDSWESVLGIIEWFSDHQDDLQRFAGPGKWNDPDMLIIGNFGLSLDQSQAQMALWAIMAAPLIMSNDLRTLTSEARDILQNKVVIAINQDPLGIQGRRILREKSNIDVFLRPLSNSSSALVFLSRRTDMPYLYHSTLKLLNYTTGSYMAYDVFTGEKVFLSSVDTHFTVSINPSGVVMWYIYPAKSWEKSDETGPYSIFRRKYRVSSPQHSRQHAPPPSLL